MRFLTLTFSFWLVASTVHGKIVFHSHRDGNTEIYVMSSDGTGQTRLTDYEESDSFPVWSPNGRQIAFDRSVFNRGGDRNDEIYVMDADGGNPRNLTRHPAFDSSPDWSPDGKQIVFSSERDGDLNIYVMAADGSNIRQLTRLPFATAPKWSPDGQQIAFEAMLGLSHGRQVYVINADGTHRWQASQPVPNTTMFLGGWSPEGTQILYKGSINHLVTNSFVVIAALNPARRKAFKHEQLPIPMKALTTVAWGADGKSILFSGRKEGKPGDIYRFRLRDGQLVRLTDHPAKDTSPEEWNSRLPVSPQGLLPKLWGDIKSSP